MKFLYIWYYYYKFTIMLFIIAIICVICCCFWYLLLKINNALLFFPTQITDEYFENTLKFYGNSVIPHIITTKDNIKISAVLYNANHRPSFKDNIIIFSHGNGGCICNWLQIDAIKHLSKYGSVLLYDYRGYGCSTGVPNEKGLYEDVMSVWKYVKSKGVQNDKIILYGHSLGTSVSSHLVKKLIEMDEKPNKLILTSGFTNIRKIVSELYHPILSMLVMINLNNDQNVKKINGKVPTYIIHSKQDDMINFKHAIEINKLGKSTLIEAVGDHNLIDISHAVKQIFEN